MGGKEAAIELMRDLIVGLASRQGAGGGGEQARGAVTAAPAA